MTPAGGFARWFAVLDHGIIGSLSGFWQSAHHHTLKEKKLVLTSWPHLSTSNKQKLWEHLDHRSPHRRSVPRTLSSPRRLDWLSEVSSIIWLYLYIICVISLYDYIILEHIWALSMYKYWIVDTNVNMLGWLCQSWAADHYIVRSPLADWSEFFSSQVGTLSSHNIILQHIWACNRA